jgi:hypothetical protein
MTGTTKAIKTLVVATTFSLLSLPAYPQNLGKRPGNGGYDSEPPVEKHQKVDEKAYKSALERIPAPTEKYDPWGVARPAEPAKSGKKAN